jgi:hypothetical protein
VTRRRLLQRLLVLLGLGRVTPVLTAHAAGPPLSPAQLDDLVAFGEVLVEGRRLAPEKRGYLRAHIEDHLARAREYPAIYRTTVSVLERLAGRPFAQLDLPQRLELVARHQLGPLAGADDEASEEIRTIRRQAAQDLIRGYYNSPAGWAIVGYQSYPGRCGDLTRYTRPEP